MKKLMRILDNHGMVYEVSGDELHVFDIAYSDEYTTLKIVDGKLTVDDEYMSVRDYLGY